MDWTGVVDDVGRATVDEVSLAIADADVVSTDCVVCNVDTVCLGVFPDPLCPDFTLGFDIPVLCAEVVRGALLSNTNAGADVVTEAVVTQPV